jgi:hypothetical protein
MDIEKAFVVKINRCIELLVENTMSQNGLSAAANAHNHFDQMIIKAGPQFSFNVPFNGTTPQQQLRLLALIKQNPL